MLHVFFWPPARFLHDGNWRDFRHWFYIVSSGCLVRGETTEGVCITAEAEQIWAFISSAALPQGSITEVRYLKDLTSTIWFTSSSMGASRMSLVLIYFFLLTYMKTDSFSLTSNVVEHGLRFLDGLGKACSRFAINMEGYIVTPWYRLISFSNQHVAKLNSLGISISKSEDSPNWDQL